jgi:hypothetical protein
LAAQPLSFPFYGNAQLSGSATQKATSKISHPALAESDLIAVAFTEKP